jgi:hypothetical protein
MIEAAAGLSVHTGWAICVVVTGTLKKPGIPLRERVGTLSNQDRFAFHVAEKLPIADAKRSVARATKIAVADYDKALAAIVAKAREGGLRLRACAVVAKDAPMPGTVAEIIAAHPRIHTAEGCLHRDAFVAACRAHSLKSSIVDPRTIVDRSAAAIGVKHAEIEPLLARAGKAAGRPWSKVHRLAALAAWTLLGER